jgi:hypothetical protein
VLVLVRGFALPRDDVLQPLPRAAFISYGCIGRKACGQRVGVGAFSDDMNRSMGFGKCIDMVVPLLVRRRYCE